MVMGNVYTPDTLVFDHIHRLDAQSEGIQHHSSWPLGSHEDYTRDIAQSMEAKKGKKAQEIATFLVYKSTNYTEDSYSTVGQRLL